MESKFLWTFVGISVLIAVLVPLYTIQYQYPTFTRLVKESVNNEASRLALRMSAVLATDNTALHSQNVPDMLRRQLEALKGDTHIWKVKLFSPTGEILYSTTPTEVGTWNQAPYFQQIVATGKPHSVEVPKNTDSLERQRAAADVVETYVPMTRDGQLIGILEIYYDITAENATLRHLITRSSTALFAMMMVLVGLVVVSAVRANHSLQQRRNIEAEREQLVRQLQDALANVKTLKGLLPICAWCKKVRDDQGYYTSLEQYLERHLDAQVTHGVCQECEAKLQNQLTHGPRDSSSQSLDIVPRE